MAFNVFFNVVENEELRNKSAPWLCDKCHCEDEVLLRMRVDYQTLVLCGKCLVSANQLIIDREKELRYEGNGDL